MVIVAIATDLANNGNCWYERRGERDRRGGVETVEVGQDVFHVVAQARDVDTHTTGRVGGEERVPGAQLAQGAAPVAAPQVVEADAGKQDTLIKVAHGLGLGPPDLFQRFVTLPVFAPVELVDARAQPPRGGVVAARSALRPSPGDER